MLEQATALVASYTTAVMVGIGVIGIASAAAVTLAFKKRNAPPAE